MGFRGFQFCCNYCVALIVTFAVVIAIELVPGLSAGFYSSLVLPLFVAATIEGRTYARGSRQQPRSCKACLTALQMMVLAFLVGKALLSATGALLPATVTHLGLMFSDDPWPVLAYLALAMLVILRVGYGFGVRSELKAQRLARL